MVRTLSLVVIGTTFLVLSYYSFKKSSFSLVVRPSPLPLSLLVVGPLVEDPFCCGFLKPVHIGPVLNDPAVHYFADPEIENMIKPIQREDFKSNVNIINIKFRF